MRKTTNDALLEAMKLLKEHINRMIENRKSIVKNVLLSEDTLSRC